MAKQFIATTFMDGYADGPHITEAQTGIANQGLYGPDDYVLDEGKKAEAQILTNNSVRVFDATFVIQGRRDVMAANAYADVTIANGEQGMYRNDIIVRKYEKDEMTEIENTSFDVIKGTPSSGVATDPEIPTGDIRTGATMHNMALYRVKLEGLNIVALEPMFKVLYNMADIKKELESLNGKIHDKKVLWTGSGIFLNKSQSIPLSESLTNQKRGIVLILSRYENGVAQNYGYRSYFVPKECLDFGVDKPGFDIPLVKYSNNSNVVGSKYIYVSDNKIEGSESNGTSPNSGWVFRYAIGV